MTWDEDAARAPPRSASRRSRRSSADQGVTAGGRDRRSRPGGGGPRRGPRPGRVRDHPLDAARGRLALAPPGHPEPDARGDVGPGDGGGGGAGRHAPAEVAFPPGDGASRPFVAGSGRDRPERWLRNLNHWRIEPKLRRTAAFGRLPPSECNRLQEGSLADVPDRARATPRDRPCRRRHGPRPGSRPPRWPLTSFAVTTPVPVDRGRPRLEGELRSDDHLADAPGPSSSPCPAPPTGWTATLHGGGIVVSSVTVAAGKAGTARLDVKVPGDTTVTDGHLVVTAQAWAPGRRPSPIDVKVSADVAGDITLTTPTPDPDRPERRRPFSFDLTLENDSAAGRDGLGDGDRPGRLDDHDEAGARPRPRARSSRPAARRRSPSTATPPDGRAGRPHRHRRHGDRRQRRRSRARSASTSPARSS